LEFRAQVNLEETKGEALPSCEDRSFRIEIRAKYSGRKREQNWVFKNLFRSDFRALLSLILC